jgi:transposase
VTTLFLKKSTVTIKGKIYTNYKIVESYRDHGKVKHRILFTIGNLTIEQAERLKMVISAHSNPDIIVSKSDDIVVTKHVSFLDVAVLYQLWQKWCFDNFFGQGYWIKAMVINRIIDPVSKINVKDWMSETVLPSYMEIDPHQVDAFDVFRALDHLSKQENELQAYMYQQLKLHYPDSCDAFFYDLTSTYMEGSRCVLAALGYSRDHRSDCEQIVIALMITPEGYPFYWRVLSGNTQDITTMQELVTEVKTRFGISKCTMVFDRGIVPTENLLTIESTELAYVSAMDRDEIACSDFFQQALPESVSPDDWEQVMAMQEFVPFDENGFLYLREFQSEQRRYIFAFDVARFQYERRLQLRKLGQALDWIKEKNQALAQAKRARNQETLAQEIHNMLKRKCVKKYLQIQIEPDTQSVTNKSGKQRTVQTYRLTYSVDHDAMHREQRLHGITCFLTNLPADSCPARETITWYRRKNKVEEAFHEIKSHLDLRPVYLSRAERVKAHVTICMLAYFLYNDLEQRLKKPLPDLSPEDALKLLKECHINRILFKATNQSKLSITEPSNQQKEVLQAVKCESVIDPKQVKQVLKQIENWL